MRDKSHLSRACIVGGDEMRLGGLEVTVEKMARSPALATANLRRFTPSLFLVSSTFLHTLTKYQEQETSFCFLTYTLRLLNTIESAPCDDRASASPRGDPTGAAETLG
jgi:hypothetical protein